MGLASQEDGAQFCGLSAPPAPNHGKFVPFLPSRGSGGPHEHRDNARQPLFRSLTPPWLICLWRAVLNIVGALQRAQYRYGTSDLEFAIERAEEVIRVRGRRLQLEGSGIPLLQFALLRVLSGLIVLTYTYLTLARRPRPIRTPSTPSTRRYVGSMASPRAGPARSHGVRPRES